MHSTKNSPLGTLLNLFTCVLILLSIVPAFGEKKASKAISVPVSGIYHLKTRLPGKGENGCVTSETGKLSVGKILAVTGSEAQLQVLQSSNPQTKKKIRAAIRECKQLSLEPSCSDLRDNDGDGLRDYPAEPQCQSEFEDNERAAEPTPTPAAVQLFRKPFVNEYKINSYFDHQYPLQFIHTDGIIINAKNERVSFGVDGHQGYDFGLSVGIPVLATYDGTVIFAGQEDPFFCPPLGATVAGNAVIIEHRVNGQVYRSVYVHFDQVLVAKGQTVVAGQKIGLSGNTGCSTGPHLHFDIQLQGSGESAGFASVDPYGWQSTSSDPWQLHPQGRTSVPLWEPNYMPLWPSAIEQGELSSALHSEFFEAHGKLSID